MKTKKYAVGAYNPDGTKKTKTKPVKKRMRHNKTYSGSMTKRRKEKNIKWAVRIMVCGCFFATSYAIAMTSNTYKIEINSIPKQAVDQKTNIIVAQEETKKIVIEELTIIEPTKEEVKNEIIKQSRQFGLNENAMLALAFCESEYIWNAKNPTSTARGVYQYLIGTWEETKSAKQGLERNNIEANIREAMIDVSNGENWRWPDCRAKLKAKGIYL